MSYIQILEFETTRPDDVAELVDAWRSSTAGRRTARRATIAQDRDRAGTYINIVEFDSYEDAMANSALPETSALSEQMAKLCDGPVRFRNLDVQRVEEM